jgi:predicted DsbA family dithiol-disulfide isomerase
MSVATNAGQHTSNSGVCIADCERHIPLSSPASYPLVETEECPMTPPASAGASELQIDVVSDVVCPWCFIGKRRLEKAIALKREISVRVRYRPYFLNPWVPRAGISRAEYLTSKFGSVDRYMANAQRIVAAARQEGLTYNLDAIARQPNTLDCHRLIRWSGESGDPARMKQRLMELYFAEGADLSDREVLVAAARDCGMDADDVRARLAGEEDVESVSAEAEQAKAAGIDGVPCFILGGIFAVSGAQAPEYLADAIDRAVAERTRREAAELARA